MRVCTKEIDREGRELASERIAAVIATMRRYDRYRVPYMQALRTPTSSTKRDRYF